MLCWSSSLIIYTKTLCLQNNLCSAFFFRQYISCRRQETYVYFVGSHGFNNCVVVRGYADFYRDAQFVTQQLLERFCFGFKRICILGRNKLNRQFGWHITFNRLLCLCRRRTGCIGTRIFSVSRTSCTTRPTSTQKQNQNQQW
ncbi:hypothetical protein D3C74_347770 [compost metagenome]